MTDWQEEHRQRVARFPAEILEAHRSCTDHRLAVLESEVCGCFYCCSRFLPSEIRDWVDENDEGQGRTALCPRCGIDAVLPAGAGFEPSPEFLAEMKAYWF